MFVAWEDEENDNQNDWKKYKKKEEKKTKCVPHLLFLLCVALSLGVYLFLILIFQPRDPQSDLCECTQNTPAAIFLLFTLKHVLRVVL